MADTLETPFIHTIKGSDTLISISQQYYGTSLLWELIRDRNSTPENPIDPNKLRPSDTLVIPGASQFFWQRQIELILSNRNIFHVYFPFHGRDEKFASSPVLVPLIPSGSIFATELPLSIESLCRKNEGIAQKAFENDDFNFEWNPDPAKAKKSSDIDAKITIKANNAWKMEQAARDTLRANFVDFRSAVEALELEGTIIPGGTAILAQLVAEALPATLDETLFFRYGFNSGFGSDSSPYVDLHPGMRLRLEYSAHQYIAPGSSLNGPVGSGQFFYTVGRNRDQQITFDAFLGAISAPDISFAPASQNVAASLIDLHAAGNARRHYRLFYPAQIKSVDSSLSNNITLIGADTLTDLKTATQAYTTSGDTGEASSDNQPIIAFTLRGRSIVIPEIEISFTRKIGRQVEQVARYVPLGTTLRQLMDELVPTWHADIFLTGGAKPVTLSRLFSLTNGLPVYRQIQFHLFPTLDLDRSVLEGIDLDRSVLDLPLAMGDRLDVTLAAP